MGTVIRAEISRNNEYYISKHRYYELKHFCLQYYEFKHIYDDMCGRIPGGIIKIEKDHPVRVDKSLLVRQRYLSMMVLIEESARMADPVIGKYVFKGVTEGYPYSYFKTNMNIPCCKDTYYETYRKFFYILNKRKSFV